MGCSTEVVHDSYNLEVVGLTPIFPFSQSTSIGDITCEWQRVILSNVVGISGAPGADEAK